MRIRSLGAFDNDSDEEEDSTEGVRKAIFGKGAWFGERCLFQASHMGSKRVAHGRLRASKQVKFLNDLAKIAAKTSQKSIRISRLNDKKHRNGAESLWILAGR